MDLAKWVRAQWDRVAAWVCVAAGAVVLIVGWAGVSRYAYPADQLPYIISGGIGGLFLLGLGAMLWLSADLRDEWRKLDEIDRRNATFYESHLPAAGHNEHRLFEPLREASVPTGQLVPPAAMPSFDDTAETAAIGMTQTPRSEPAVPATRRSTTATKSSPAAGAKPKSSGRRAPKQGLAQP